MWHCGWLLPNCAYIFWTLCNLFLVIKNHNITFPVDYLPFPTSTLEKTQCPTIYELLCHHPLGECQAGVGSHRPLSGEELIKMSMCWGNGLPFLSFPAFTFYFAHFLCNPANSSISRLWTKWFHYLLWRLLSDGLFFTVVCLGESFFFWAGLFIALTFLPLYLVHISSIYLSGIFTFHT